MARGKAFIGLVLTERQAKSLLTYARMMRDHGAGPTVAKDMRHICAKLERSIHRATNNTTDRNATP